jgi:hypothetical protein
MYPHYFLRWLKFRPVTLTTDVIVMSLWTKTLKFTLESKSDATSSTVFFFLVEIIT